MAQKFSSANQGQAVVASVASSFFTWASEAQAQLAAVSSNLMVCNPSAIGVWVRTGAGSVAADNTCVYIPPATVRVLTKPLEHTGIAILAASGAPTINFIHGTGE